MNTINSTPINPPLNTLPVLVLPIDWQRVRAEAAIAAMQALMSEAEWDNANAVFTAEWAREYADALIAELQKKEVAK